MASFDETPTLILARPILLSLCNSDTMVYLARLNPAATLTGKATSLSAFVLGSNPAPLNQTTQEIISADGLFAVCDSPCSFVINNTLVTTVIYDYYVLVNSVDNTLVAYLPLTSPISVNAGKKIRMDVILRLKVG